VEAARILSNSFSGYATLRNFYTLRDEDVLAKENNSRPAHRLNTRKKKALNCLLSVIQSASSSIRGGLYDPDADAVVQVDGLLVLLGEALPFLHKDFGNVVQTQHLNLLLEAVEDLSIAPNLIWTQCNECLMSAIAAASGAEPPSPRDMLKKSISALSEKTEKTGTTGSSQFSLVGSSMLPSGQGSRVLNGERESDRGWDWRVGFRNQEIQGENILSLLRFALAEAVARQWAKEQ
jgi:hypothetical protein